MRRDVHLAMVAFWTSVPLFAVYPRRRVLVGVPQRRPPRVVGRGPVVRRGGLLGVPDGAAVPPGAFAGGRLGELPEPSSVAPRVSEWLVYPIVLVVAVYLLSSQILFF